MFNGEIISYNISKSPNLEQIYDMLDIEEIAELRARFNMYMENRRNYKEMLDFYKLDMIRSNPSMISKKFKDTLEDLKNTVMDKMNT